MSLRQKLAKERFEETQRRNQLTLPGPSDGGELSLQQQRQAFRAALSKAVVPTNLPILGLSPNLSDLVTSQRAAVHPPTAERKEETKMPMTEANGAVSIQISLPDTPLPAANVTDVVVPNVPDVVPGDCIVLNILTSPVSVGIVGVVCNAANTLTVKVVNPTAGPLAVGLTFVCRMTRFRVVPQQ